MAGQRVLFIGKIAHDRLGEVWVAVGEKGLAAVKIHTTGQAFARMLAERWSAQVFPDEGRTAEARSQLAAYLQGERKQFDIEIDWSVMTPFQEKVLRATCAIPRGETRSYGEIAAAVGNPRAARAVGRAQATNPMPLVIPCHRVIGADGGLHGYGGAGGLQTKAWLLELEGVRLPANRAETDKNNPAD